MLARALLGPGQAEKLRPQLTQLLKMCMGLAPLVARFNERVRAAICGSLTAPLLAYVICSGSINTNKRHADIGYNLSCLPP